MRDTQCLPSLFISVSQGITGRAAGLHSVPQKRRFRCLFGVTPQVCSNIWQMMGERLPNGGQQQHLLWGLLFLKIYGTEDVLSSLAGVDRKTFRKWAWEFIHIISCLNIVSQQHFYLFNLHIQTNSNNR